MPEAMTSTARKKARKAAAKARAERDNRPVPQPCKAHMRLIRSAAGLAADPDPVVIPRVTALPAQPAVAPGDRVQLLPRLGLLFPGAQGRVAQVKREHGVTSALVVLDRRNSAGLHLKVWRACLDLYVLAEGEWRRPRPRVEHEEQLTAYATPWG